MKDRDELVELMAEEYTGAPFPSKQAIARMNRALDALEAAGCTVVPNEATEEMVAAMISWINNDGLHGLPSACNAAITASPYRRK